MASVAAALFVGEPLGFLKGFSVSPARGAARTVLGVSGTGVLETIDDLALAGAVPESIGIGLVVGVKVDGPAIAISMANGERAFSKSARCNENDCRKGKRVDKVLLHEVLQRTIKIARDCLQMVQQAGENATENSRDKLRQGRQARQDRRNLAAGLCLWLTT